MVLEELNLPYKMNQLEFSEVKTESYLKLTPNGRLPTLKDPNTGITLWEVRQLSNSGVWLNTDIMRMWRD